ncbi:hypothetical protein BSK59_12895 [Paenibacillus odorifer]|uniref:phage tail domain-containing protein n=1 Tax=Paenibacillus odorifer TaxID=189426 RepID=UPI00096E36B2|nr:phage tail domain-containing protein [Paenibacillus odorifer]OME55371.1 hypothetical protein BSK59_12895 [Paenibacillus odorifer]
MNFKTLINLDGMYTSPVLTIPLMADGVISKISWEEQTLQQNKIIVQTCYSNDGDEWSDWKQCINNAQIPDINLDTPIYNTKFKYRVIIQTQSHIYPAKFKNLTLEFEPVLIFDNKGDSYCTPEVWITKYGSGDFSLINVSNKNEEFKLVNLINNETVYVNNELEHIESDIPKTPRYDDFNDNYMSLPFGKNIFKVVGNAKIKFRHQFSLI